MQIKAPEGDISNKHSLLNSKIRDLAVEGSVSVSVLGFAHSEVLHYTANVSISPHPLLLARDSTRKGELKLHC